MTQEINNILQDLIGLPLTRTTRSADMECLKFGTLNCAWKEENAQNIGEFALHLQCPWRITNDKEILVGSNDLYEQVDEAAPYDENFDWEGKNTNLRDVKLDKLISETPPIVKAATADKFGGLQIVFHNHIILTVFPVVSSKAESEYWRLLDNRNESKNHYLSTSISVL